MSFIELTSDDSDRTIHVLADRIEFIEEISYDDISCTRIQVGGVTHQVVESPEEVLRRIRKSTLSILTSFIAKYGDEEGVRRFQAGENPP